MLTERQPLATLDPNAPRVQPTRAAKTGHKWLGLRRSKNARDENFEATSSRLGCAELKSSGNTNSDGRKSVIAQRCDNYQHLEDSAIYRPPLRDVAGRNRNNGEDGPKCRYFPPLQVSQSSVESMSIDTSSDSSFRSVESDTTEETGVSWPNKHLSPRNFANSGVKSSTAGSARYSEDLRMLDEYLGDILTCLRDTEAKYMPNASYLDEQSEITAPMRVKLVDWLVEVQDEYKLHSETLHLGVTYVDRFLSTMSVTRSKLQLLGTTAMFIAAKFEEICPPDADEFSYVTADTYTRSEVLMMERLILGVFDFKLAVPTAHQFIMIFSEKSGLGEDVVVLSHYLSELALLDHSYLKYAASVRSAASLTLAIFTIERQISSTLHNLNEFIKHTVQKATGTDAPKHRGTTNFHQTVRQCMQDKLTEVHECAVALATTHREHNESKQSFVYEKHSVGKLKNALKVQPHLAANDTSTLTWCDLMRPWTT